MMVWNCKPECSDCCGSVPMSKELLDKHEHQVKVIKVVDFTEGDVYPMTEDTKCVFLERSSDKCTIYESRPKLCQDYGILKEMPCPFIKSNGNPRNPAQVKHFQRKINHDVDDWMRRVKQDG